MIAEEVLAIARSPDVPGSWMVWPLRRDRVLRAALGWVVVAVLGFLLLIPAIIATVPGNFESGGFGFVVTGLLLILLAAVAFGSAVIAIFDFWRLRHADEYLLVMTPDDFVKQEPGKVIHVPMENIAYVTLRGAKTAVRAIESPTELYRQPNAQHSMWPLNISGYRRKPAESPSLAFVDLRDNSEVVISTDNSFDELPALEHVLGSYVGAKERSRSG